jgi:hypothetical protein
MKKLRLALSPMVAAAVILALSGVAVAQARSGSSDSVEVVVINCPQPRVTNQKITENEARDLAQSYADKNLKGFNVVRPNSYGGGYQTVCYKNGQAYYSVEYSIDAENSKRETRILRVDQFGNVTEFRGTETGD